MEPFRFQIALSFPGGHRSRIEKIASALAGVVGRERVLYDKWHRAEFARPNLDVYLPRLYHEQSRLLVFFLCAEYAQKEWCGLEWRAARDLLKRDEDGRLMFLRLDPANIPGLYSIDGYLDISILTDDEVAREILKRLETLVPSAVETQLTMESDSAAPDTKLAVTVMAEDHESDKARKLNPASATSRRQVWRALRSAVLLLVAVGLAYYVFTRDQTPDNSVTLRYPTIPVLEPEAAGSSSPINSEVMRLAEEWRSSFEERNLPRLMGLYNDTLVAYYTKRSLTKEEVARDIVDFFSRHASYRLTLSNWSLSTGNAGCTVAIEFDKQYQGKLLGGQEINGFVRSELIFQSGFGCTAEDPYGRFLIVSERDVRVYPPPRQRVIGPKRPPGG